MYVCVCGDIRFPPPPQPVHQFTGLVVEAQFDCLPDRKDELGFREGERIVVTKKLNADWWVRSILYHPCSILNHTGCIPGSIQVLYTDLTALSLSLSLLCSKAMWRETQPDLVCFP